MATKFEVLTNLKESLAGDGFLYLKRNDFGGLVNEGLAEVNEEMRDGNKIATRITQAGIDWLDSFETSETETTTTKAETKAETKKGSNMSFQIASVPMPSSKPRGRAAGASKYPFDLLEVGQMFFVPATEEKPEPWRSMASIVSDANRRNAIEGETTRINRKGREVPKLVYTKRFVLRQFEMDGVQGAGIWREA